MTSPYSWVQLSLGLAFGILVEANPDMKFTGDKTFRVITVEDPPFVSIRENPFNKTSPLLPSDKWSGYIIDLIRETSRMKGFNYTLSVPEAAPYNYGLAYNHLAKGDADICFSAAYITTDRLSKTIMTSPFKMFPLSLLVKQVDADTVFESKSIQSFISKPFEPVCFTVRR